VEVIVINDGSKDGSAAVAQSYGDRIVYVEQENRGLSGARNTGIAHASGDFIVLCDSDDVLLSDCVEKRLAPMLEDESIAIVAGYYREIDEAGNRSDRVPELRVLKPKDHYWQELRRNYGPPLGWAIRKSVLSKSGVFDPMLPHCEDLDLCLRILRTHRMAYVPDVTVLYRQHAGGQSKRHLEYYMGLLQVLKKNSCYTDQKLRYWVTSQYGKYEAGRRILYAIVTSGSPGQRFKNLLKYCALRPEFIVFGICGAFAFIGGKRASSKVAVESP
jgi:glycosyltransferase involved in cell wall biosynthesis